MQNALLTEQAQLTADSIKVRLRRQIHTDCAEGILTPCSDVELDRIVAATVDRLWAASRVKIYVPVLALRQTRDEIRAFQMAPA